MWAIWRLCWLSIRGIETEPPGSKWVLITHFSETKEKLLRSLNFMKRNFLKGSKIFQKCSSRNGKYSETTTLWTDPVELFPSHRFNSKEGEVTQAITVKMFWFLLQKLDRQLCEGPLSLESYVLIKRSSKLQYAYLGSCICGGNIIKRNVNNIVNTFVN